MCTLVLAYHADSTAPIRLFSSRDERLDRPSSRPRFWGTTPEIFAPRDELAGGTWLGTNEHKLVVAITNRFGEPRSDAKRSRGEIVRTALEYTSAKAATDWVASTEHEAFNPFHLLLADLDHAAIVWCDGAAVSTVVLEPGWSVVTEQSFGAAGDARRDWLLGELGDDLDRARVLLRETSGTDPFSRPNVLVPELGYGTRSNTFINVTQTMVEFEYVDSDGALSFELFQS